MCFCCCCFQVKTLQITTWKLLLLKTFFFLCSRDSCLCSHLQSSTGDLCLIKRDFQFNTLHSPSTASLPSPCFPARSFQPSSPGGERPLADSISPSPRAPRGTGCPMVPWPAHVDVRSPSTECRALPGCGPAGRLRGAGSKQRQLVTQHGVAGPRSLADAASAVTGCRAPAPEPGSDEGAAVTVTGRCQTATLRLKPATALRRQSPSPPSAGQGTKRSRLSRIVLLH